MKYFSSDWHIGHKNVLTFSKRPFKDINDMNQKIIDNMLSPLKNGDSLYFLGDLCFQENSFVDQFFSRLDNLRYSYPDGVKFIWIRGNHDYKALKVYEKHADLVRDILVIEIKGIKTTLCHFPMLTFEWSYRNCWQLFGHHHLGKEENTLLKNKLGKQINVCCENFNFKPVSEKEIIKLMKKQPNNWDLTKRY